MMRPGLSAPAQGRREQRIAPGKAPSQKMRSQGSIIPRSGKAPSSSAGKASEKAGVAQAASLAWLYLILLFSSGFYLVWWERQVAADGFGHSDPRDERRVRYVSIVVPGLGWPPLVRLVNWIGQSRGRVTQAHGLQPWVRALPALLAVTLYQSLYTWIPYVLYRPHFAVSQPAVAYGLLLVAILLAPLPFVSIQRQLNAIKKARPRGPWGPCARRGAQFETPSYGFVAIGFILVMAVMQANSQPSKRSGGEALTAGQPVAGESNLFTVTPVTGDWVRMPAASIHEDADLTLYGATDNVYLLAYIKCDGTTIDTRTRFRRGKLREVWSKLELHERRVLTPEMAVPVAYARYSGVHQSSGTRKVFWTVTAAQEDFLVEVIGVIKNEAVAEGEVEALVRSMELREGATSCGDS